MSYETETKQETGIIVTDIKIFPFKCAGMNNIRALANVILNDAIMIRGLRIMEGTDKPFLSYPAGPFSDGASCCSFIIPVTRKISEYIEDTVIKQYQKEFANASWTIVREYRRTVGLRKVSEEELNKFKQSQEYKDDVADGFHFSFIRNKE